MSLHFFSPRFIIYKLPRNAAYPGNHYAYLDSHDVSGFKEGVGTINNTDNAVTHTLQQVTYNFHVPYSPNRNSKGGGGQFPKFRFFATHFNLL